MDYWKKQDKPLFKDLDWNFPEKKSNTIAVIGGNGNNFSSIIKLSEYLNTNYPIEKVATYLPDSLKKSLPPLPDLNFLKSTDSGSFAKDAELDLALEAADFALLAGDLSKNSETAIAITEAIKNTKKPILLARDTTDLVAPTVSDFIEDHSLFFFVSIAQLQKLFRSLLYPKMIMLSQPLLPAIETLHKFTLSYEKCTIITMHQSQIIIATGGNIITTPLEKTKYTPLTFFTGSLPADLAAYNLWNIGKPLEASSSALLH